MATRKDFQREHDPLPKDAAVDAYVRRLEAENAALKAQVGTDETLFEFIKDTLPQFPAQDPVRYPRPKLSHSDMHAVLVVTDAHAEELVRAEEMEGLAAYDWGTFLARTAETASKTLEMVNILRQASKIDFLDIFALGDWFLGKILPHEGAYGVSMPLPVAVPKVGIEFGRFLMSLAPHFKKVRVHCMCGNHGRDGRKTVFKMTADRNWDMSVYLIAQAVTEPDSRIEWHISPSIMDIASVAGWNCLITHSGEVNMNNRVPYYPIESTFDMEHKCRAGTDKDFQYAFTGHWHHHALLDSSIVLCPCMIGANQFSRFKLHRRSSQEQLLCFFNEKHGLLPQWPLKLN